MRSNGDFPDIPRHPPLLVILSGPSGAGKDSLCDVLISWYPSMHRVVTATTRAVRPGEEAGRDYYFISDPDFDRMLATDGFVEHATVHGRRYGVPRIEIEDPLGFGRDAIARVDVQGAATLKGLFTDSLLIFVTPGSVDEAARRMRDRDTDTEAEQKRRIDVAEREMNRASEFDHVVVNERDKLEEAAREVARIIAEEKQRRTALTD